MTDVKTISLPDDVGSHVAEKISKGWAFSSWVAEVYRAQFMTDWGESPLQSPMVMVDSITDEERKFLQAINKIGDHAQMDGLLKYYNGEFKRGFSLVEFRAILNAVTREQKERGDLL